MAQANDVSPTAIAQASSLELVRVMGCEQTLAADDIERVRDAIERNGSLSETLEAVGVSVEQVIGAGMSGEVVTIYIEHDEPVA